MAGEKLAKMIMEAAPKKSDFSDLVFGKVISVSPLKIRVENRFEITKEFILLSKMVQNMIVTIRVDGKDYSGQVFRNLQTGDTVRMLKVHKGQLYYVLERV